MGMSMICDSSYTLFMGLNALFWHGLRSRVFPIRYTTMPTLLPKLGNISPYIEEVEDSFTPYESREPRAA